jgi:IclR family transcriptional regulator, KDG regulon repressor
MKQNILQKKLKETKFYNRSLERALQILISFNSEKQAMTLTQLAKAAQLPKSTVLRLCSTLLEYGFLQIDEQTRQYSPGLRCFEIGRLVYKSLSLNKIASHYLIDLQKKVQQTVFMDILQDDQVLHIDKKEDPLSAIRFGLQVGAKRPPHYGAPAQVLMAHLPDDEVERLLKKFPLVANNKKTITDNGLFKERLRRIRNEGYFLDEGETVDGISVVGAPIHDHAGKVIAAIAAGYVSESLEQMDRKKIIEETVKTAIAISQSIGYMVPDIQQDTDYFMD